MTKLTKEQSIVVSAYTGFIACDFSDLHEAVESRLGRPIFGHELGSEELMEEIRDAFREDFLAICYQGE